MNQIRMLYICSTDLGIDHHCNAFQTDRHILSVKFLDPVDTDNDLCCLTPGVNCAHISLHILFKQMLLCNRLR